MILALGVIVFLVIAIVCAVVFCRKSEPKYRPYTDRYHYAYPKKEYSIHRKNY